MTSSDLQTQTAHLKNTAMRYPASHFLSTAPQFRGPHASKNSSHYPPPRPNTSPQLTRQRNVSGSADSRSPFSASPLPLLLSTATTRQPFTSPQKTTIMRGRNTSTSVIISFAKP